MPVNIKQLAYNKDTHTHIHLLKIPFNNQIVCCQKQWGRQVSWNAGRPNENAPTQKEVTGMVTL